jgi:hypothetical protein
VGTKFNVFDKIVSAMKDYHLPVLLGMFGVGAVLSWFHRLDMAFVSYAAVIVGGITGHAFSPAQKDHDNDDQPK